MTLLQSQFCQLIFSLDAFLQQKKILFSISVFVFSIEVASAAPRFSVATGNWNAATTWAATSGGAPGASVPIAGDVVVIENGNNVTITANAACTTLTVSNGTTLTIGGFTLTVSGVTTVGGGISGSIVINSATGTKTFTGAVTINTGASITESAAAALSFGSNVTITGTLTEFGAATVGIAGSLTNNGTYTASTGTHTFSGTTQTISGTSTTIIADAAVTGTYTNSGTLTVSATLTGAGTLANTGTLNLSGVGATSCTITTLSNAGTINRSNTGTTTTALANFTNTGVINISGSGTLAGITNNAGGTVNHTGSSTITSFNNATATSVLNLSTTPTVPTFGTLTVTAPGNTVNYNGAGPQTVRTGNYQNLILSGSGVKLLLGGTTAIGDNLTLSGTASTTTVIGLTIAGNLNIGNGTSLTLAGFNFAVTGTTTIGGGASGQLNFSSTTGTKTFGTVAIGASATWNNTANEAVSIGGNLSVGAGATFTQGTGRVTFTGATSNTVTNTGTIAFGGGITVDKGISQANVIDFQGLITMLAGGLILTNGTFRLSSASTITAFTANPNFGGTARLWCDGGTILAPNTSVTYSGGGAILVTAGTLTIGTTTADVLFPNGGSLTISGGALNVSGVLSDSPIPTMAGSGGGMTFNMSGGVCTVNTAGSSALDFPFFIGINFAPTSTFTMTGGTIVIQNPSTLSGGTAGFFNDSPTVFTGGSIQIGNASTLPASTIGINTTRPIYNLTVNSANATAIVQGQSINITNEVTISSGTLNANSFDISVGGNWTNNGTFSPTTATVTLNGTAQTIGGSPTTFHNLVLSGSNTKTFGVVTTIAGNLSIATGVVANLGTITTHTARSLTLSGNGQIPGSWGSTASAAANKNNTFFTAAAIGILNVSNRIYFSRQTGNWNAAATWSTVTFANATNTGTFPVAGDDVNIGGGNFTITVNVNSACGSIAYQSNATFSPTVSINLGFTLNVSGAITIPRASATNPDVNTLNVGAGTLNAGSILFTNSAGLVRHQMTISTGIVTVTGDITTNSTGASASITFTGAGTLNAGLGIFTTGFVGGTLTTFAGSTVNYNGTTQTINSANYLGNLTFSGSGVKTMTGTTSIGGNFTLSGSASTTAINALTIGGNVTLGTGTGFTAGAFIHNVAGNWINNGATFTNTGSTINLNGTAAQTVGGTASTTFNNLTLNNTFGTIPQFIVGINTTATSTLTMTSGVVNLAGFTFTLGSSGVASTLSRTASTTTNWMYGGTFRRFWLNATAVSSTVAPLYGLFPVGSSTASSYRPVAINSTVSPTATGSYSVTHVNLPNTTDLSPVFNDGGTNIVRKHNAQFVNAISGVTGGTYNIGVTMTGLLTGTLGNIRLGVSNGVTTITTVGTHAAATGTAPNPTANRTGVPLAGLTGDFRITSTNIVATPLPIELTSFNAFLVGDQVELTWTTASELNNDFFTIERSSSGEKFEAVKIVKGKGSTNLTSNYQAIDENPLAGTSYYQLKQTDFDGKSTYSDVKVVENKNPVSSFKIYPNPVTNHVFTLEMNGVPALAEVPVSVVNMQGVTILQASYPASDSGNLKASVDLGQAASGVYLVVVNTSKGWRKMIVIK
jgi:hypothetical protein